VNRDPNLSLPDAVRSVAQAEVQRVVAELSGVLAAVVATADGFDAASCVRAGLDPQRIAALASSIAAIGDVVSREAGLGHSTGITVSTESGFAIARGIRRQDGDLVLFVIGGADAVLAQVNYSATECVRRLERP
jgi:predicted regulator of Ras-like GTPase activity (Roadblock/LC7/MglB family)